MIKEWRETGREIQQKRIDLPNVSVNSAKEERAVTEEIMLN